MAQRSKIRDCSCITSPQGSKSKQETRYEYVDNTAKLKEEERLKEQRRLNNERILKQIAEQQRIDQQRKEAEERRRREGEVARTKRRQEEDDKRRRDEEEERRRKEVIRQRDLKLRDRREKLYDYKFGDKINLASFRGIFRLVSLFQKRQDLPHTHDDLAPFFHFPFLLPSLPRLPSSVLLSFLSSIPFFHHNSCFQLFLSIPVALTFSFLYFYSVNFLPLSFFIRKLASAVPCLPSLFFHLSIPSNHVPLYLPFFI